MPLNEGFAHVSNEMQGLYPADLELIRRRYPELLTAFGAPPR